MRIIENYRKRIVILFVTVLFLIPKAGFSQTIKFCQPTKVDTPPKIDGVLDETVWQKAQKMGFFASVTYPNTPAAERTNFSILYDEKNLYIGIECKESKIKELVAKYTKHDDPVYEDDCIEIFIDTNHDHSTYYHFVVNSLGVKFEESVEIGRFWDGFWEAKTKIGEKSWFVEVVIPFTSLEIKPQKESVWGLNVNREHYAGGSRENSGWSDTGPAFHTPKKFGHLVFDPLTCLRRNLLPSYQKKREKERPKILKIMKPDDKSLLKKFNRVDSSLKESIDSGFKKKSVSLGELSFICERIESLLYEYYNLKYELKRPSLELWF